MDAVGGGGVLPPGWWEGEVEPGKGGEGLEGGEDTADVGGGVAGRGKVPQVERDQDHEVSVRRIGV